MVMPILARALLEKRARFGRWRERMGEKALFAKHPAARGYLRAGEGYRLMDRREELVAKLMQELGRHEKALRAGLDYPLAPAASADGAAKVSKAGKKARKKAPAR